jgi:hypothetical protein
MATNSSAIQKKIETLKKGLNNKFITASQKEKIKAQVEKLESQSKALAPKKSTKTATSSSLTRLQKLVKNKKYSVYKGTGVDLKKDSDRPAKAIGKRTSKSGKTYYEYRANRIDVKQPPKKYPKLEKGGYMARGGNVEGKSGSTYKIEMWKSFDDMMSKQKPFRIVYSDREDDLRELGEDNRSSKLYMKRKGKYLNITTFLEKGGYMADGGRLRWNNVSIHINKNTEEDMRNAGFSFEPNGNAPLYYNGKEVGFVSNFNGVMLNDEYVDQLVPMFNNFRGAGVWNYRGWKQEAESKKRQYSSKMAKGGSLSSIKEEYDENEDNNAHSENVVLLAKHFGTKEDLTEAKRILALHEKEGSLSSDNGKKRQQLHLKLIEKARTEMAKDGIKFAKGGGVLSNYRLTFMNDNGEKKYMTTESYNKVEAMKEGKWWEKNPDYHIAKGNYKVVSVVEVEEDEDDDKDTSSYKIRNERRRGIRGKGVTYNSDYTSYPNVFNPLGKPRYEDGGMMADGGVTEKEVVESNAEMVLSQIKAVKHHAEELSRVVSSKSNIEAWVVGKIERASTDLSDITHYLEGNKDKMSMGGTVRYYAHKMDKK